MARSNLVPCAFVWEKGKTMDFSETIVIYGLKLAKDNIKTLFPGGCMVMDERKERHDRRVKIKT